MLCSYLVLVRFPQAPVQFSQFGLHPVREGVA